jgi:AcrR family transcriptional regulator
MPPRTEDITPRPRPGRAPGRRSQQARSAVLHAADDLLAERGFHGVTIEGIAARAGVAKQTIYRWWPSKVEILFDTLREDADSALAVPAQDSVREELRLRLRRLAAFLREDPAGQVLLALIGQAQHDKPTAAQLRREFFDGQHAQDRGRLQRGVDRGELPADLPIDDALDALYGPVYYRALISGSPIGPVFLDRLVETVLGPVLRDH